MSNATDEVTAENERLREANEHLRERVGELESLRVEWRTRARQLADELAVTKDHGRSDMDRAAALAQEIRPAQASALNEAADEIERAVISRLDTYVNSSHAETARLAIEGCLAVLRRRAREAVSP